MKRESGNVFTFADMLPRHGWEVGRLHATIIKHSFISGLGAEFLERTYEILLTKGYGTGTVILDDGQVVGFAFGRDTMGPSMGGMLFRSAHRFIGPLAKLTLTRPRALWNSIIGIFQSKAAARGEGVAEWMSVGVIKRARTEERSYELVKRYFDKLKRDGYHTARGAAHEENVRAQKFFLNTGGRIYETSYIAGKKILWFEWDLTRL